MKRITRVFILIKVLESLSIGWVFGTYVLFLLSHGLTLLEANLLNLGFMTTSFLFDPFTGHLADRVGQKKVYVWGQVVLGLGTLIYGLGRSFNVFLAAEVVAAIGGALMSEALESWLRNHADEETTHRTITRTGALASLGTVPTALLGSIAGALLGLNWVWLLSALSFGLTALLACALLSRFPEDQIGAQAKENLPSIRGITQQVWRIPALRFTIVIAMLATAAFQPLNMFWAPLIKEKSGSAWWLGALWLGIALAVAVGSYLADRKWARDNGFGIALALVIIGFPILIIALISPIWPFFVSAFLVHEIGRGAIRPLLFTYSNRYIEDNTRATANSIRSALGTFGAASGLLASGLLTLVISPLSVWGLAAIALIFLGLYAWRKG